MNSLIDAEQTSRIGWALLHSVWQIGCVALILKGVLALLPSKHSTGRYVAGCVALVTVAWLPLMTFSAGGSLWSGPIRSTDAAQSDATDPTSRRDVVEPNGRDFASPPPNVRSITAPAPTDAKRLSIRSRLEPHLPLIVLIWFVGVILSSLRILLGEFQARRLLRVHCRPVTSDIEDAARSLARSMRIERPIRILQSTLARVPMVIGWLRPHILLPISTFTGLSPSELETILMHELAHIRRHDAFVNAIQNVLESLFFYHPAIWWMSRVIRTERENCCDDLVLRNTRGKADYIRALTTLEESRAIPVALSARGGDLVQRVRRMLGREESHRVRDASVAGSSLLIATLLLFYIVAPLDASSVTIHPGARSTATTEGEQRTINQATYDANREYLRDIHHGRWVAIVDGVVIASFDTLDAAVAAADERNRNALHRFLFRPGIDDGDEDFVQSPWLNSNPGWNQVGVRFRAAFPMTISYDAWYHDGRKHATPDGEGLFGLAAPGATPTLKQPIRCSSLFQQDLSITGQIAEQLQLARFSVPGTAWLPMQERVACRKALCRLALDDLGIDAVVVAFVIAKEVVDIAPPIAATDGWSVEGRVVDASGLPLPGATIRVFTGSGTLRLTNTAITDAEGRYSVTVTPSFLGIDSVLVELTTISASYPEFYEANLNRQGGGLVPVKRPSETLPSSAQTNVDPHVLIEGEPAHIDFTMIPAASVDLLVVDERGVPLSQKTLTVTGETLPASQSVLESVVLPDDGTVRFGAIPANRLWWFEVEAGTDNKAVATQPLLYEEGSDHSLVIVVDTTTDPMTARVEPRSPVWDAKLKTIRRELATRTVVRGIPSPDDASIAWGPTHEGLQAGLRFESDDGSIGARVDVGLLVRNVGSQTVMFQSSDWRQEDDMTIHSSDGTNRPASRTWYSGRSPILRYELRPGEAAELTSAPFALKKYEADSPPHPIVYHAALTPGEYDASFTLSFPDIVGPDVKEGDFRGTLVTGKCRITVKSE